MDRRWCIDLYINIGTATDRGQRGKKLPETARKYGKQRIANYGDNALTFVKSGSAVRLALTMRYRG
jgi:hypothetical protein